MANEAEILENPTSTPAAVSTGYQRQNTNAVAGRVGMDATVVVGGTGQFTLEISGPVDVNGVLYQIATQKVFNSISTNRYYIYLNGSGDTLSPTLTTNPGTFDADKNARYTAGGYRVLNWVIDYDGTTAVAYRWLNPSTDENCFVENDVVIGNDLTVENDLQVDGNVDIDGDIDSVVNIDASGNIVNNGYLNAGKGRKVTNNLTGSIYNQNDLFDALSPSIPNINDTIIVSGAFYITKVNVVSHAVRHDANTIYLYYCSDTAYGPYSIVNGSSTAFGIISLAW